MIELGKTYILFGYDGDNAKFNDCEVTVSELDGGRPEFCIAEITKLSRDCNEMGRTLWPHESHMKLTISKPHVYSPVFMTGRYKTVGD